jgi:hypothetical protein
MLDETSKSCLELRRSVRLGVADGRSRMGMAEQSTVNSGIEEVIEEVLQESHRRAKGKGRFSAGAKSAPSKTVGKRANNPGKCDGESWSRHGSDVPKFKATQALGGKFNS